MAAQSTRPNILWVSLEDTSPRFGCYGDRVARTPHLDQLAAEGCRWEHAFSTCGVCAPARSAVITGCYPIAIGTHHMRTAHANEHTGGMPTPYSAVVPAHVKCFTEYLRAAGYYCCNNVKTDYQFDPPLTAWDDCSNHAHWRNRPDPEQPFFAVFNPVVTHESGMWPEKCPDVAFDPAAMVVPPYLPDTPAVRLCLARLYTNLEQADAVVGRLLAELEEDGLADQTVVFHWSDHGPLPRGKRWPYDAGIRVPLIVRWPGHLDPGSVSQELVSTIDLAPTVLNLAGVPTPTHLQGQDFLGPDRPPARQYVYASRDRHDEMYDRVRAVRDQRFKYLRNYHPEVPYAPWVPYLNRLPIMAELWRLHAAGELQGDAAALFWPRPPEELYDTVADPHELRNLAADPAFAAELDRLRAALDAWLTEVGDLGAVGELEMVRRWYPDGRQPVTSAPLLVPLAAESWGTTVTPSGGTFCAPALLQLHCSTQGASIAYTLETGEQPHWRLYSQPLALPEGDLTVRARAVRIGYQDSPEVSATFTIRSARPSSAESG